MLLGENEIGHLALGAAVFGGGGGGDPHIGEIMARLAVRRYGPVELVDLEPLDDGELIVPCAMVGAPTVMVEKFPAGDEGGRIIAAIEKAMGRKAAALTSAELGGLNGVLPIAWAAHAGIPVVDCDLMARAFPELQMTTASLAGIPISPVAVTDERTNTIVFETIDSPWAETLVRSTVGAFGGSASMGIYPMTVAQARIGAISGSLSRAIEVGRVMSEVSADPVDALCEQLDGYRLISGKVVDVERRSDGGFARGSAVVDGTGRDTGRLVRFEFQNENLAALEDGKVVASVPDIITAVDVHTGHPITTENLRYGQRVSVMAMPCDPFWRSPEALAIVGPRVFGYEFDYETVESIHG